MMFSGLTPIVFNVGYLSIYRPKKTTNFFKFPILECLNMLLG